MAFSMLEETPQQVAVPAPMAAPQIVYVQQPVQATPPQHIVQQS
jgi:hypothetical protein